MSTYVRQRFPDSAVQIEHLYEWDHEFRALCHDYGVCVEELRKEGTSPVARDSAQRLEQLRELRAELEADIAEYLNKNSTQAHE